MSEQILTVLRERTAFKPKPPDYELALAHVPLDEVGLANPIEQRVLAAMRTEDESFVLIVAPPGGGKSSLLAWAAWQAVTRPFPCRSRETTWSKRCPPDIQSPRSSWASTASECQSAVL